MTRRLLILIALVLPIPSLATDRVTEQQGGKTAQVKVLATQAQRALAETLNEEGEELRKKGDFDEAIRKYTDAIQLDPNFTWPFNNRGLAWAGKGEFEKAIADYNEAIRLDQKYTFPLNNRGLVWAAQGENDKAIADYSQAIKLDPQYAFPYNNRPLIWERKGEFAKAIADYADAIELDAKYLSPLNALAWIRATCSDPQFRAGKEAVEFATKACDLSGWKSYAELDTLAAAHAEAGEFTMAVIWQMTAVELAPKDQQEAANARLERYRANQPFHQSAKP